MNVDEIIASFGDGIVWIRQIIAFSLVIGFAFFVCYTLAEKKEENININLMLNLVGLGLVLGYYSGLFTIWFFFIGMAIVGFIFLGQLFRKRGT